MQLKPGYFYLQSIPTALPGPNLKEIVPPLSCNWIRQPFRAGIHTLRVRAIAKVRAKGLRLGLRLRLSLRLGIGIELYIWVRVKVKVKLKVRDRYRYRIIYLG